MNEREFIKIIRRGFDQASEGYDRPAMKFFDNAARHLVNRAPLKGNEYILDVASGTGKVALLAAARLKTGKVIGVDLSRDMLKCAKTKAHKADLENIDFQCKDINRARFAKDCFDGIFCSFGMFFFSDMKHVLLRLMRTLKPKGFIAITSFADGSFRPLSDLILEQFRQYGAKLPDSYTWERLDSCKKHQGLFHSAGLKHIQSSTKQVGYYLKNEEEWWDIVYYTGFRSFYNQLSKTKAERYKQEYLAKVKNIGNEKGVRLNVEVIFTIASMR